METVIHGECIEVMRGMEPDSVDAIVCDPPYALTASSRGSTPGSVAASHDVFKRVKSGGFMGAQWDAPNGGSPLAFQSWCTEWATEALRVAKPGAYLLAAGSPRTYHRLASGLEDAGWVLIDCIQHIHGQGFPKGKGQLKPGYEPWTLARKPAPRVLPLQIDACRIGTEQRSYKGSGVTEQRYSDGRAGLTDGRGKDMEFTASGRWPANVILSEEAAAEMDLANPTTKSVGGRSFQTTSKIYGEYANRYEKTDPGYGDVGGPSRYFYCPKASTAERMLPDGTRSTHPTTKPISLMRWMCRLVTPPNGTILDPFAGSGTTLLAARQEGFDVLGIEREAEYIDIIHKRLATPQPKESAQLSLLEA